MCQAYPKDIILHIPWSSISGVWAWNIPDGGAILELPPTYVNLLLLDEVATVKDLSFTDCVSGKM